MKMINIESSFVEEIGFENGLLRVVLKNGTYDFCNVSESLYNEFLNSTSKGQFFNDRLKNNISYRC